ncbi:MAG: Hsp70 family protein [Hymenobacter sp.]
MEAVELRSNTRQQVEIKPQYGLTDEQVEQMLMDSLTNAKQDVAARLLIEARTAAEQLLYQVGRFTEKERCAPGGSRSEHHQRPDRPTAPGPHGQRPRPDSQMHG